jgi:Holliday junction resolvase
VPSHYPNSRVDNEAQLGQLVADLFRENGWKVLHQSRKQDSAPDLIASRPGKKLIMEIKRASEGRRDRVIPLLSQAALEAAYYSRNFAGNPIPVAIVGAKHISDSVSEEAKEFVQKRAPEVAVGLLDFEGLRSFAGHGLEDLSSKRTEAKNKRTSIFAFRETMKAYFEAPFETMACR